MADTVADLGDSSSASSPASEDIDDVFDVDFEEQAKANRQQRARASPSKTETRQAKRSNTNSRKTGEAADDGEGRAGPNQPGPWADVVAGPSARMSALDKLLDTDYPRDFGDPVLRFKQAREAYQDALSNQNQSSFHQPLAASAAVSQSKTPDVTEVLAPAEDASMS